MVKQSTGYIPARGDAVWVNFDPQAGHEQAGRRPALVLSSAAYNGNVGLAIICPITNKPKGYPFEVPLPTGLSVTGNVLADHVKSLDWQARNAQFLCRVPNHVLNRVIALIEPLLKGVP